MDEKRSKKPSAAAGEKGFDRKLRECLDEAIADYFRRLDGAPARKLYKTIGAAVEETLLRRALFHAKDNRAEAAAILGVSRATLARKLAALNGASSKPAAQRARRKTAAKKSAVKSAAKSAVKPVANPAAKPADKSALKPSRPVPPAREVKGGKPALKAAKSAMNPSSKPAAKPVVNSAAKPAMKSAAKAEMKRAAAGQTPS